MMKCISSKQKKTCFAHMQKCTQMFQKCKRKPEVIKIQKVDFENDKTPLQT